jgi:hypothetical protein
VEGRDLTPGQTGVQCHDDVGDILSRPPQLSLLALGHHLGLVGVPGIFSLVVWTVIRAAPHRKIISYRGYKRFESWIINTKVWSTREPPATSTLSSRLST